MEALRAFKTIKKDTPYDRLDPRTRFFLSTVLAFLAIYSSRLDTQLIVLTCVLSLSFMAKRVRVILRSLYGSLFLLALIFTLNFVFTPNLQGAIYALVMTLRFTTLITSFALFFNSTSPEEIGIALEGVGVPRDFSLLINMSFRFVPTLANDIQIVSDALRSRGLELEKGRLYNRIKNYVYLLVPLIIFEVRRSMMIAEALEARGYGLDVKPTRLVSLKFSWKDYLAIGLALLGTFLLYSFGFL
ncbi:MAG: energy-coupling factor transporter transmembrane protein EcfT [Thermofilum sp.]|uniref:energy-coupling factor transporter transmembrane component T family protein n=1 Tax=Thermofilum sp. TaxID=1961369 RepID=UPI00258845DC|nr:energy-coupling factor transporter transmembrane component T [Thermofilum sp.]MCI4409039.1 energy-coupling factor transporter transmembrane protein EcfT [Thermofilum sp.]